MRQLGLLLLLCTCFSHCSAWGFCNDENSNCHAWAKDGHCEGENKDFMRKSCAHSCGHCHHLCRDVEDSCAAWAKDGHCESNPTYMLKYCATSCGVCKPRCYDQHGSEKCAEWARNGECSKNPSILATCPVACGVCTDLCLDKNEACAQWAHDGQCHNNTHFMLKECPRSCNVCDEAKHGTGVCENRQHRQCMIWGEHECTFNPAALLTECPKMCGACTTACVDKRPDCPGWAKAKDGKACEVDKNFLPAICPYSCGVCSTLEYFPHNKDEI